MKRRDFLISSSLGAAASLVAGAAGAQMHNMQMAPAPSGSTNYGLTLNLRVDPTPLENEFEKYPNCTYCGMFRQRFSHTRHLVVYANDMVDGTCSIHCASLSLALNLGLVPKAIYVGDAGDMAAVKPLIDAETAHYVIDPNKMGTMSAVSKWAYGDKATAEAAAAAPGATLTDFSGALLAAYTGMSADTDRIRSRRAQMR